MYYWPLQLVEMSSHPCTLGMHILPIHVLIEYKIQTVLQYCFT